MTYYVAKSYQNWEQITEPYEINQKMYIKVRKPSGGEPKQVRAYTEPEYRKLYGETCANPVSPAEETSPFAHNVKKILGFDEGYIWIFKGDLDRADYWFEKTPECRYHVDFGWYIVSTDTIPFDIPSCIESIQLPWEKVGNSNGTLLPKSIIQATVDTIRFGTTPSQFQGKINERLELSLYLRQIIALPETQYGISQIYCLEDTEANQFAWTTAVKKEWEIGDEIHVRGTVKAHETIKGVRKTILTRVMEVKK